MNYIAKIIQISDTHLYANVDTSLLGVNTHQSFQAVIKLLQQEKNNFDLIIHTGDISQDYSESSYTHLAEMLKPINKPIYCVPGNHDDSKKMEEVYPREMISNHRHILVKNWQFILLDSHQLGSVAGFLDGGQLNHLHHCLQAYPNHHSIICFHHHPTPVGSRWLDNIGLKNANEFWQVMNQYSNVKAIFFGHVHQEFEQKVNGIPCYSTPSTCFQFKRKQVQFSLENLPPGYRWIELYADGRLVTKIKRVAEYVGEFAEDAKGY